MSVLSRQGRADRSRQGRADRSRQGRADRSRQGRADRSRQGRADRSRHRRADHSRWPRAVWPAPTRAKAVRAAAGAAVLAALWALWAALGTPLFASLTAAGVTLGAIYALAGLGLVITYRASGVFNFGHGAIAMFVAYVLWQLHRVGVPVPLAAAVAVALVGPGIGVLLARYVFRPLAARRAGAAEELVATVGVFMLLVGVAVAVWGPETRTDPVAVFSTRPVELMPGVAVSVDQVAIVAAVAVTSGLLYLLFTRTRVGLRMRAVVERRDLAELAGVDADRVSAVAWAIGSGLAGLTGVLLAPATFGLDPFHFTLLVAETFAIAVIARLDSLVLAVAGGAILGLATSYGTQLDAAAVVARIGGSPALGAAAAEWTRPVLASLPVVALFLALFVHRRFRGTSTGRGLPLEVPAAGPAGRAARRVVDAAAVAALLAAPLLFEAPMLRRVHDMLGLAVVFVSIVLVTGYGGHITLGQAAFAGFGAFLTGRLVAGTVPGLPALDPLPAMLLASVGGAALGFAVGYPALRRRGVLLGLTTFAIGLVLERFVFANYRLTAGPGTLVLRRPSPFGWSLESDTAFHYFLVGVAAAAVAAAVALRRSRVGRTLRAMRDSEAGARAVGVRPRRYVLGVFVASTAMAALGGSLLAQTAEAFSTDMFGTFDSLIWFTAVVVAGVTTIHGAVLAAFALSVLSGFAVDPGVLTVLFGVGILSLGHMPGGLVGVVVRRLRPPTGPAPPGPPWVPAARPGLRPSPAAERLLRAAAGAGVRR